MVISFTSIAKPAIKPATLPVIVFTSIAKGAK